MIDRKEIEGDKSDEQDIDAAIELTGFGKFSIKIVIISGLIYANAGYCMNSISFVYPAAACDFHLNSVDNGNLITIFILGMVFGSYFWICLSNIIGLKHALVISLCLQTLFEALSSIISTYSAYLTLKFFSGLALNGQIIMLMPYVGEFQSVQMRKKVLCLMEVLWVGGIALTPVVGWAIIPLEFSYVNNYFSFHSWNLYILINSLPSLLLALWLLAFPETPKYLAEFGNASQLAKTLDTMHFQNTGRSFDDYLEKLKNAGLTELYARLTTKKSTERRQVSKCQQTLSLVRTVTEQTLTILKPPHLKNTVLVCGMMFCLGSAYYSLSLWFPELFRRFSVFEEHSRNESPSVCTVSVHRFFGNSSHSTTECHSKISMNVYSSTLIVNASALPISFIIPLTVNRLGFKFYLVSSAILAAAATIALFVVVSSTENLILSAVFAALTTITFTVSLSSIVELYPTNVRITAATFSLLLGRIGSLVGNLLMGHMIDNYCMPFIIIVAVELLLCGLLGFFICHEKKAK